ncbi:methyltransferase family protein [Aeromonas simiae]|uniref:methyltransferase family protein n=1 Tax=Aeromonas simiae TaxID=218936 RepID=UPI00266C48D5|nr:methyltransferase [Aeromonas simiae]MDO2946880.1 isoprenylcysteine carboxylmethyltransferase family protein [Aeromonas simiae]MDO2951319.1 isoprenylcysteine carboxylmethyltransferase family protein [Aeromonas simiae]MDO2954526.1 isoprenylcysteine carboxylmethyltransferase family protein [Aeromonas simiae]
MMKMSLLPPPLVALLCAWLMQWGLPLEGGAWGRGSWLLAALLWGLAALLGVGALLGFRHAGTTVDPRRPDRSSALVISGVYRYSRNPMYLGVLLLLLLWALWLGGGWWGAMLFWLWMDRLQIPREEQALGRRFGADYERYCQQVRRWC